MFSKILIKKFVENNENYKDEKVRSSYGYLASVIGIISNLILFVIKFVIGFITGSIAITADAFNNLSDVLSSIITIVGFKLAQAPPDKEHPFGHGRMEYISAFIISFMVMIVGFEFLKTSIERILNPSIVKFALLPFILLIITIFVKLWLGYFNTSIGKKINSSAIKATGMDAFGDVFASTCVAISFLAVKFTTVPVDAYVGGLVSFFIIYAGLSLLKETISSLLGEAPDPEFVEQITNELMEYNNFIAIHDLMIHNYGVGNTVASVHVEFPADVNIIDMHNTIDQAEREISEKHKLLLTIHMDPIYIAKGETVIVKDKLLKMIEYNPLLKSMHDFRIIEKKDSIDLRFDIVVHFAKSKNIMSDDEIINSIKNTIKAEHPKYNCIITLDRDYTE
ncbi:cation diffusion facilitator family transporter [uncultured Clostridium sp.]|jgi:cation diffusion facilitator family transporter|uniref:cation diffusion facilitator family transporter n=1 Tax=uncultured Clostridium sp. TaxID=59620 RepID=UPI0026098CEA|nr:cation diffusion facilitator family transporter [uncultured Clostridium sp.]